MFGSASPVAPRTRAFHALAASLFLLTFAVEGCSSTAVGTDAPDGGGAATSDPQYEALFGPPASTTLTSDSIMGVWADTDDGDVRLKISSSSIVIALRCGNGTVGGEFAARVTSASLKLVESRSVGSGCSIQVKPLDLPKCTTSHRGCFSLVGTTLDIWDGSGYGGRLFEGGATRGTYTKLSD